MANANHFVLKSPLRAAIDAHTRLQKRDCRDARFGRTEPTMLDAAQCSKVRFGFRCNDLLINSEVARHRFTTANGALVP